MCDNAHQISPSKGLKLRTRWLCLNGVHGAVDRLLHDYEGYNENLRSLGQNIIDQRDNHDVGVSSGLEVIRRTSLQNPRRPKSKSSSVQIEEEEPYLVHRRNGKHPHHQAEQTSEHYFSDLECVPLLDIPETGAGAPDVPDQRNCHNEIGRSNVAASSEIFLPTLNARAGSITCQFHPHQSIHLCPRECSWSLEQANETAPSIEGIEPLHLTRLGRSICEGIEAAPPTVRPARFFRIQSHKRFISTIRICHVLIVSGVVTLVGSLIAALWRTEALDDMSGGFTLGQYCLEAGALVVGCATAVHVKYCTCWQRSGQP